MRGGRWLSALLCEGRKKMKGEVMKVVSLQNGSSVEALASFIREQGLSVKEVAKRVRCSVAKVSQVLNGKYRDAEAVAEEWLRRLKENEKGEFLTTAQQALMRILKWTQEDKEMALVVGESGVGKSFCVERFARENEGVFVFRPTELSSPGGMLRELGLALGIKVYGSNEERLKRIVSEVKGRYSLVIVDEADVLCESRQWASVVKKLSVFRQMMEAGVGVVLVGLPVLEEVIRQMPGYFQNRIGYFLEIKVSEAELKRFVEVMAPEMERRWQEVAIEKAKKGGFFRFLKMFCEKGKFLGWEMANQIIFWARR